jgi:hypothetical protein
VNIRGVGIANETASEADRTTQLRGVAPVSPEPLVGCDRLNPPSPSTALRIVEATLKLRAHTAIFGKYRNP